MQLFGLTLMVAGCFVAAFGGVILAIAWAETRATTALLWWAAGHFVNMFGAASFAIGLTTDNPVASTLGAGGIVVSMTLYWAGTRTFFNHAALWWPMAAVVAAWLLVTALTFRSGPTDSVVAFAVLTALIMCAAGGEAAVNRGERLGARWPLVALCGFHAAFMLVGVVEYLLGNLVLDASPDVASWFGLVHFERLVFLISSTVLIVVIARERREIVSATAAYIDALTGIANRGAFFTHADRLYRRSSKDASSVSLIVFDLDHFKAINDTHGHLAGDTVLKAFADAAGAVLRPGDLFGRIGGEEFAAVLPGAGAEVACIVAERVRHAFEMTPKMVRGAPIRATVSAGVAAAGADAQLGNDHGSRRPRPLSGQGVRP